MNLQRKYDRLIESVLFKFFKDGTIIRFVSMSFFAVLATAILSWMNAIALCSTAFGKSVK